MAISQGRLIDFMHYVEAAAASATESKRMRRLAKTNRAAAGICITKQMRASRHRPLIPG